MINATLSGSAHGGRGVAELGGGGWLPVLFRFFLFFFPFQARAFTSSAFETVSLARLCADIFFFLLANALVLSIGYNCKPLYLRRSFTSHSRSGNSVHFPLQPLSLLHLAWSRRLFIPAPYFLSRSNSPSLLKQPVAAAPPFYLQIPLPPFFPPSFPASSPPARWSVRRRFLPSLHHSLAQFQCF